MMSFKKKLGCAIFMISLMVGNTSACFCYHPLFDLGKSVVEKYTEDNGHWTVDKVIHILLDGPWIVY